MMCVHLKIFRKIEYKELFVQKRWSTCDKEKKYRKRQIIESAIFNKCIIVYDNFILTTSSISVAVKCLLIANLVTQWIGVQGEALTVPISFQMSWLSVINNTICFRSFLISIINSGAFNCDGNVQITILPDHEKMILCFFYGMTYSKQAEKRFRSFSNSTIPSHAQIGHYIAPLMPAAQLGRAF